MPKSHTRADVDDLGYITGKRKRKSYVFVCSRIASCLKKFVEISSIRLHRDTLRLVLLDFAGDKKDTF